MGDTEAAVKAQEQDFDPLVDVGRRRVSAAVDAGDAYAYLELVAGEEDIVRLRGDDEEDVKGNHREDRDAEDEEGVEPAPPHVQLRLIRPRRPFKARALPAHRAVTPLNITVKNPPCLASTRAA